MRPTGPVLEVNANPSLSQDTGFTAAAGVADIDHTQLVNNLVGKR
jgi:hypothetical protein